MAKTPIYTYPADLREAASDGRQPFMSFALKQRGSTDVGEMVFMYLPASIAVSDGATYSGVDLGTVKALRAIGDGNIQATDVAAKSIELAKQSGVATLEAGAVEFGMSQGLAVNPFQNMAFEGMSARTWTFEFKLLSESAEEATAIKNIENWFRKNMYAVSHGSLSLKYPPMLRTQFWEAEEESKYLPMIMDSYITGLNVVYNESNSMYHPDGAPVETSISLSLSENKTLTRSDLYLDGSLEYNRKGRDEMKSDATDKEQGKINDNAALATEGPQ